LIYFRVGDKILTPKSIKKPVNLRVLPHASIYGLLLAHARTVWSDISIVDDFTAENGSLTFSGLSSAISYPFLVKDGIRYGCSTAMQTDSDQFALLDIDGSRLPCQIVYHFELKIDTKEPVLSTVIRRLLADSELIPQLPWDL
jgi:hypothetical protein